MVVYSFIVGRCRDWAWSPNWKNWTVAVSLLTSIPGLAILCVAAADTDNCVGESAPIFGTILSGIGLIFAALGSMEIPPGATIPQILQEIWHAIRPW
jgi:hypothetical protein